MTQREEVRFKVYTKTRTQLSGTGVFPLELIDFLEGDGTYDTTTYTYNVQNAGTYLLGFSCNKRLIGNDSAYQAILVRIVDGVSTSRIINRELLRYPAKDYSLNSCFMYKLEVGDELYCQAFYGNPVTILNSYTSDDTLNSFWGIRLDY